jgi:hypothetical protein
MRRQSDWSPIDDRKPMTTKRAATRVHKGVRLAACFAFALFAAVKPAWSTVLIYNAQLGTLPTAQGWTSSGAGVSAGTLTNSGTTLVATDTSSTLRAWAFNTAVTLNSTTEWQTRAMLRLNNDFVSTGQTLYDQYVSDNVRSPGFSVKYLLDGVNPVNQFGFFSSQISTRINVPLGPFYEVVLTKSGTTGTSSDTLLLQVYDATGTSLQGSISRPYTGESAFNGLGNLVEFGNFFSNPTGTYELKWATFGIGEAAPFIQPIPEPASLSLGLIGLGWFMTVRSRRRIR